MLGKATTRKGEFKASAGGVMYQFSVLEVSGWRTGASDANTLPTAPHAAGEWQPYSDRLSRGRAQGAAADGPRGAELVKREASKPRLRPAVRPAGRRLGASESVVAVWRRTSRCLAPDKS